MIKQLNAVISPGEKKHIAGLIVMMFIGGILELIGVSAVFPLISVVMDSNASLSVFLSSVLGMDVESDRYKVIIILAVLLMLIYVLKNLYLTLMYGRIFSFIKNGIVHTSAQMFSLFVNSPYDIFMERDSSELERIVRSDVEGTYRVLKPLLQILSEVMICVILGILLFITDWRMSLFMVMFIGVIDGFFILRSKKLAAKLGEENIEARTFMMRDVMSAFGGIKELKILGTEDYFIELYSSDREHSADCEERQQLYIQIPRLLTETLCIIALMITMIAVTLYGSDINGMIPVFAVFAVAAFRLLPSVGKINGFINEIAFNRPALESLYNEMDMIKDFESRSRERDSEKNDADDTADFESIEFKNVSFRYNSGPVILDGIDLRIEKGETIGIVGKSGAGKTTLVDLIMGLLSATEGSIIVNDEVASNIKKSRLLSIGYVPQDIYLANSTVLENVAFGIKSEKIDRDRVKEVLQTAQAYDFVEKLAKGMDTLIGERGVRLSGGQKQRLGIARALYRKAEVLIFDEATSALDNKTEDDFIEAVSGLKGKHTMILIAHRVETLAMCDRILEVNEGKVLERTFEDIKDLRMS